MDNAILGILWLGVAYVAGSIPFGLLFARTFCGIDPRTAGSKNVGSTNVARLCGKSWGAATLVCDMLKGAVPVYVATLLTPTLPALWTLTAFVAICGHLFSCFLQFKGGKAVATTIGVFVPLAFWPILGAGLVCLLIIWRSGFVSLGSLTLVSLLPILLILAGSWYVLPLALVITVAVFWSHRENIKRLARGEEKTWIKKS